MSERDEARAGWIFDELPPSGARRGGDPAIHAFKQDLESFVREVVQNANDQRVGQPAVRFRFVELGGEALEAFLAALAWPTLRPHLQAAAAARGGEALGRCVEELSRHKRLLLLHVEDRHTVGLTGGESGEDSHFTALCKDTLYSHKQTESAGGRFGLGKSVLWRFSGLSTVLFSSVLQDDPPGLASPRVFGRAELPSHTLACAEDKQGDGQRPWFTGSGWFGRRVQLPRGGERAESLWGEPARRLAGGLHLTRDATASSGTSILILDFRDPTADEALSPAAIAKRVLDGAARYFWPAMTMADRRLSVSVEVGDEPPLQARAGRALRPFVVCYRNRTAAKVALEEAGDVVVRRLTVELPARRDKKAPACTAHADLVVRLAAEGGDDPLVGHVALFRGAGMVVRYWDRRNLALEARPFHAVLVCGEARSLEGPSAADRALESFLRDAEPPGHDDWCSTAALKERYRPGYAKALARLSEQVTATLRELVAAQPAVGRRGPDRLRRRFPIGQLGGGGSEPSDFSFSGLWARLVRGRWEFEGEVRPAQPGPPWRVEIALHEVGDDGKPIAPVPIAELLIESDQGHQAIDAEGRARIAAGAGVEAVAFLGASAPLPPSDLRGELRLEVRGVLDVGQGG